MALLEVYSQITSGMCQTNCRLIECLEFVFDLEYFLCRALCVVWTTPLVATLGMSLTIPLAMVADMLVHGRHYSAIYILGSVQVI